MAEALRILRRHRSGSVLSFEQVEPIFHEALLLPEHVDGMAWLAKWCRNRMDVMAEVSSLLAAHDAMGNQVQPDPTSAWVVPSEQVGAYRLIRLLGRGGMSAVYLGERVDGRFDKQVAVKVIAAHLAGEEFLGAGAPKPSSLLRSNTPIFRLCWIAGAGKFLRRHWPVVTAAAVFVLGLSTATVIAVRHLGSALPG
jgi:hypothetical protein